MDTTTRKPRAVRREQIVGAVLRIISEEGIGSLTTTALARDIGVTSGALFRHFDTRDEILEETVRYVAEAVNRTFPDPSLPPAERLYRLATSRIEALTSQPGIGWFLHSDQAALSLPPAAVAHLGDCARRTHAFVLGALKDGVGVGSIRGDIPAEHLLVMFLGTIHAFVNRARLRQNALDVEGIVRALMLVIAPHDRNKVRRIPNDH